MTVHNTTKDYAVITGASGELGAKLAHRLLEKDGRLNYGAETDQNVSTNCLAPTYQLHTGKK